MLPRRKPEHVYEGEAVPPPLGEDLPDRNRAVGLQIVAGAGFYPVLTVIEMEATAALRRIRLAAGLRASHAAEGSSSASQAS